MSTDLHAFLRKKFDSARADYAKDLAVMTTEQLNTVPGGVARCGFDFTFEVAFLNRRIATRLRGEVPGPPPEGWIVAPEAFRVRDRILDEFHATANELLAAWDALPASDLERVIELPSGSTTTPVELMYLAAYHTGYHDAQLNYLQAIFGDGEVHWGD